MFDGDDVFRECKACGFKESYEFNNDKAKFEEIKASNEIDFIMFDNYWRKNVVHLYACPICNTIVVSR